MMYIFPFLGMTQSKATAESKAEQNEVRVVGWGWWVVGNLLNIKSSEV